MAEIKIIWSRNSKKKLYSILEVNIRRIKSKTYSIELLKKISKGIKLLLKHSEPGMKTSEESVMGFVIESFIVYYEVSNDSIFIHSISPWLQNPDKRSTAESFKK